MTDVVGSSARQDNRRVQCAYCGVLFVDSPEDHPMVYEARRRYLRAGQPHPLREATALRSHEVVNLEPWGRMHAGTCEVWARRNPKYGGAMSALSHPYQSTISSLTQHETQHDPGITRG